MGSESKETPPAITMTMAITMATMGRLTKNEPMDAYFFSFSIVSGDTILGSTLRSMKSKRPL
jgi:hypothetical protein